jgi:DNA-binding NarL/FixJ family response regulator
MEFHSLPREALARHREMPFNVVVTDLKMPELDGFSLVQALQEVSPEIVSIILTGTADLAAAVKAINESKVFRFYPKPTPARELIRGIETAIRSIEKTSPATSQHSTASRPISSVIENEVSVFDHLRVGVIVVDEQVRVVFANRTGAEFMAQKNGLMLTVQGICHALTNGETKHLHDLVRQTIQGGSSGTAARDIVLPLSRRSSARPLAVVALHYGQNGIGDLGEDRLAVLLLHDPEIFAGPTVGEIGKLLGLSASEAVLAKCLAEGESVEDASRSAGLTLESGRTYLKRIFRKTGTKRQAELVRMVLTATLSR